MASFPFSSSSSSSSSSSASGLLYRNRASVNVGQLYRYIITYDPTNDHNYENKLETCLWLKVRNLETVALRAAYLAGPFILYVDVRPSDYDQNVKVFSTAEKPVYDPQLKAGQSFYAQLFLNKGGSCKHTWIVDVVSQLIFSNNAEVQFELSVGHSKPDVNSAGKRSESTNSQVESIFPTDPILPILSPLTVKRYDTIDVWHHPTPRDENVHLVVLTHGLHSNIGADMLYLKESIDNAAKITGENIMVRGYFGNVGKTEKGVKYLGRRLADYIVNELAPENESEFEPKVTKISFIAHSLGGLVQTFAIAHIASHHPTFFDRVEPINYICLASPFLGISNENPGYVKFALDLGFVGKSGQDLGLTRRHITGKKPLLQILPTGPTHKILVMFKRRTLYANAVNDGIVPLRTAAILYLDWRGLGRVEKAKRGETPEGSESVKERRISLEKKRQGSDNSDTSLDKVKSQEQQSHSKTGVIPEAKEGDETAEVSEKPVDEQPQDEQSQENESIFKSLAKAPTEIFTNNIASPVQSLISLFAPQGIAQKKSKIYKRSQTIDFSGQEDKLSGQEAAGGDHSVPSVPKKTSVFESGYSVLIQPLPSDSFINDPDSRPLAIFHDRVYRDSDLPPRRFKRRSTILSPRAKDEVVEKAKVEEQIARDWHRGMSWRKVLVRLQPDAHNNIVVRRRFANAYGWPVIEHLAENHFLAPYGPFDPHKNKSKESGSDSTIRPMDILSGKTADKKAKKFTNDEANEVKPNIFINPSPAITPPPQKSRSNIHIDTSYNSDHSLSESSSAVTTASSNSASWDAHLNHKEEDSEDEGIILSMGTIIDNIRDFGNNGFSIERSESEKSETLLEAERPLDDDTIEERIQKYSL